MATWFRTLITQCTPSRPLTRTLLPLFILLITLTIAAGVGGCSSPADQPSPQDEAQEAGQPEIREVSMRLQWFPQYQFAGYIVAKVKGYYEEEGLDVTLSPGSPDFVPLPLVASGSDTFGSTGADTIFLAREKGLNVVSLATIFQTSPVAFMVHSDSGITSPSDFMGRTVGVFYGDNVETEYRALLAATDVDRSKINEVPAQFNLEPFLSRRVDVWPVYVPDQPDLARQQGAEVDLIVARDYGVTLMGDVLFTTEEFINNNPNTTRAFVHATLRGWRDALTNVEETINLVAEYNPQLSRDHLAYEAEKTVGLVQYGPGEQCVGWNGQTAWEKEQQLLHELGLLEATIPLETAVENEYVRTFYDHPCAEEANPTP